MFSDEIVPRIQAGSLFTHWHYAYVQRNENGWNFMYTINGTEAKIISKAEQKYSRATKCKNGPPELSIFVLSSCINAPVEELFVCIYYIVWSSVYK